MPTPCPVPRRGFAEWDVKQRITGQREAFLAARSPSGNQRSRHRLTGQCMMIRFWKVERAKRAEAQVTVGFGGNHQTGGARPGSATDGQVATVLRLHSPHLRLWHFTYLRDHCEEALRHCTDRCWVSGKQSRQRKGSQKGSPRWRYWHLRPDNSLLAGAAPCAMGCWAASLASTH